MARTPTIVLVPGFMQGGRAWSEVARRLPERYRRSCVDLRASMWLERVDELLRCAPARAVVAGYSMGGRLALHAALREPGRFAGLITVGVSAGIDAPGAREQRLRADERLAEWIEGRPIEEVVRRWERLEVFASQTAALIEAQRPDRLAHDPVVLARLLRTGGQGALEPVWERLPELGCPLLALAGERDPAYVAAARRMAALAPAGRAASVPGAGHAAHLEQPAAVAGLLEAFAAPLLESEAGEPRLERPPRA